MIRAIASLFVLLLILVVAGAGGAVWVFYHFGRGLPDYHQLADYEPPVTTRVYAGDGQLLAEYAAEKRIFVPVRAVPRRVIQAFLAAEDKNFYTHPGIDLLGVLRAAVTNFRNMGTDRRPVGASTITQQVAKNFLLDGEVSMTRKIKEAILAFRIEHTFSKDRLLELYLNEIYLGYGSYGVAAAALNYFNKSLDEISVAEAAFLAALPKAPNNYNPLRHPLAAKARRDWAVGRMEEDGYITADEAAQARAKPLIIRPRDSTEMIKADHFAEEVRRILAGRYGERQLYEGGLLVRATLDPHLQAIADRMLRHGLEVYDRRHGWRGPVARIDLGNDWRDRLAAVPPPPGVGALTLSVVLAVDETAAEIGFTDGRRGRLPLAELKWARPHLADQAVGPAVRWPADVVAPGDVVLTEPAADPEGGPTHPPRQRPAVAQSISVGDHFSH